MEFANPIHEKYMENVWPDMEGIGEKLDECHREPRSPYHLTIYRYEIKFEDEKNKDRYWELKQLVLAVIGGFRGGA